MLRALGRWLRAGYWLIAGRPTSTPAWWGGKMRVHVEETMPPGPQMRSGLIFERRRQP